MRVRTVCATFVFLLFVSQVQAQTAVTFDKEVMPILQQHCQTCHRPGNIAPFSLLTYQETRPHALQIKQQVESHAMPPWKPVNSRGVFQNERYLTESEIQTISKWVEDGVQEGDPADLPPPVNFPETWSGGEPDMVLQAAEPYTPEANQHDVYRCFTIPLSGASGLYVRGYDVQPGNRAIVHHVILFTDSSGASVPLDDADPGPGYTCFGGAGFGKGLGGFGGWAPGGTVQMFPTGTGVSIPPSTRLVLQVHYSLHSVNPNEPIEPDLTRVGLYLSPTPVEQVVILPLINTSFAIPPGQSHYPVVAILPILVPVDLLAIAPHMHLLGRQVTVDAWLPFLQRKQLIRIDDWSFHWQAIYNYQKSVRLPAGTILVMTEYFDNSTNNPENPSNPPVTVRFGEQTTDEMAITFLLMKSAGSTGPDSVAAPSAPGPDSGPDQSAQ